MHDSVSLPTHVLAAFLLVMARMGGVMTFIPMPGLKNGPDVARILLAVLSAFLLFPVWSKASGPLASPEYFLAALASEAVLGIGVGLAVSYMAEILAMAAQSVSLQAGYGFASTIDPTTEADAGFLVVLAQLLSGLLFFACGIDRQVLAILGRSFERVPPGASVLSSSLAEAVAAAGSTIFSTGLRLALPVIALLAMTDIALALIGRLNPHVQVQTLGFPAKMIAGLALLAWITTLIPTIFQQASRQSLTLVDQLTRGVSR
jgi:flagellar biosynthetic protein FliR